MSEAERRILVDRPRLTLCVDDTSAEDTPEQSVLVLRGTESSVPDHGIRFQRCGGGRRIIRRSQGGSY